MGSDAPPPPLDGRGSDRNSPQGTPPMALRLRGAANRDSGAGLPLLGASDNYGRGFSGTYVLKLLCILSHIYVQYCLVHCVCVYCAININTCARAYPTSTSRNTSQIPPLIVLSAVWEQEE